MNLRKEESLAYIFDPISNTYIDDEDQSLGNKLALSQDAEDIIKKIDEQFGPGTVFPASELPPKENPYKDFQDRNPAANGGMMRQNFYTGELVTEGPQTVFQQNYLDNLGHYFYQEI